MNTMTKVLLTVAAGVIVTLATLYLVQFLPNIAQNPIPVEQPAPVADGSSTIPPSREPANTNHPADWSATTLTDASPAVVLVDLPADAKLVEKASNHWTFADAYLEKSRSMKTIHLDSSSKYDAAGCLKSNDLERVISTSSVTLDSVPFCVQTGLSVGAGQVYRTLLYSSKSASVPLAIAFTIHYANSVQVYAGCETAEDLVKPECVAREFHDDDMKLFTNIIASFRLER